MKPHITNLKHQKFCLVLDGAVKKANNIQESDKILITDKVAQLKNNKKELDEIYASYEGKLKELSRLLGEYERVQQGSRVHLRKMQLWLKFTYNRV